MRPLRRMTIPAEPVASRTAYALLLNVFGPYCAISEEPLYDVAYVWNRTTNSEFPFNQAPAERWSDLLLLSPATCEAWRRHHDRPSSQLMIPDQEITFQLDNSPISYSLETVNVVLIDNNDEIVPTAKSEKLVIAQGNNERARATIDTFSLNTEYFNPATKELRLPAEEYLSRRDAPLRSRTVAWKRATDAAEQIAGLRGADRRPLVPQLQISAAATGHWSVWATVLWNRLEDRELLFSVLGGRPSAQDYEDLVSRGPYNEFPGTALGWLPRKTKQTAYPSVSEKRLPVAPRTTEDRYAFRVGITFAGSLRSEAAIRNEVRAALAEATKEFRIEIGETNITTHAEAVGGFLGLGATEWPWIISVAGPIVGRLIGAGKEAVTGLGKQGVKQLFTLFKTALRKRNLSAGTLEPVKAALIRSSPAQSKSKAKEKSGHTTKKQNAAKPASKRGERKSRRKLR